MPLNKEQKECSRCGGAVQSDAGSCPDCRWPFSLEGWVNYGRPPFRITLDTGCINQKGSDPNLNLLEAWASEGKLNLQKASAMLSELQGSARIVKASALGDHPGLFTIGVSMLNGSEVLAGPDLRDELSHLLFPTTVALTANQEHDIEHLRQHIRAGGDVFVTRNPRDFIVRGSQEALRGIGVWVMTPDELVALLQDQFAWN